MLTNSQLYLGDQGLLLLVIVHDMLVLLLDIVSMLFPPPKVHKLYG